MFLRKSLYLLGLLSFLTACSSGGGGSSATSYTGITSKASISDTNAQSLSVSSTEAAKSANSANSFSSFKTGTNSFDAKAFIKKSAESAIQSNAIDVSEGICSSGTVSIDGIDENTDVNSNLNLTIRYGNCTISDLAPPVMVNGTASFQGQLNGTFTLTYSNFTVTSNGMTETINMTITCSQTSCSTSSDFTGSDGRSYRLENFDISGSEFSGYSVSGRVYDPEYGYIDISTTTPITFNCSNGFPGTGVIEFSDGTNAGNIAFNDCFSYSVTFNGSTVTYSW